MSVNIKGSLKKITEHSNEMCPEFNKTGYTSISKTSKLKNNIDMDANPI